MLNQLALSAIVASQPEYRFSQDGTYKVYNFFVDVAPVGYANNGVNGKEDPYTRIKAALVVGKDSPKSALVESLQVEDIVYLEGSLHINKMQVGDANGSTRNVPEIQVDDIRMLQAAASVPEDQEIDDTFGINKFIIVGRPGSDPEVKYFESGTIVANLSLAVDRPSKNAAPDWVPVTIWGQTAEVAANYVKKGSLIGVTGQLKFEHWVDRNSGENRMKSILNTGSFAGPQALRLLGSPRGENAQSEGVSANPADNNRHVNGNNGGNVNPQTQTGQVSRRSRAVVNTPVAAQSAGANTASTPTNTAATQTNGHSPSDVRPTVAVQSKPASAPANYDDIPF